MNLINRILNNFRADLDLLLCNGLTVENKIRFIFGKYYSILLDKRSTYYFGYNFKYDMRMGPLLLEFYPSEFQWFSKYINFKHIKTILVIGENVGQTGFTMKVFCPHLDIYSFEPNTKAFEKLKINAKNFSNWKVYNFAIGEKSGKKDLYYTENSTVGGSFYKELANEFQPDIKTRKTSVPVTDLSASSLKKLKIPGKFDLVLIDVEGAELEVIKSLKNIQFNYLIVEVALKSKRDNTKSKVEETIKKYLNKKADLLAFETVGNLGVVANCIYKIN
jgi:FkbM family methyltransferase